MVKINYLGHDCFYLEGEERSVLIDPFLTGNPTAQRPSSELKPDVITVTHGHGDHLGDAIEISKKSGAPILGVFELANYCEGKGAKAIGAHMGGIVKFEFGWVKLVQAWHSSTASDGTYTGNPCGFVVNFHGINIYHPGDTCLFGDMKLIAEMTPVEVFLCPIGDHYTMGIHDAVKAVELVNPRWVIPMHYNTFDVIKQNPETFRDMVEKRFSAKVMILNPGSFHEFSSKASVV